MNLFIRLLCVAILLPALLLQQPLFAAGNQSTNSVANTHSGKATHKIGKNNSLYFDSVSKIPPRLQKAIDPHIIPKTKLLYLAWGHLNKDKHLDILLALYHEAETSTHKQLIRPVLLLINNGQGEFKRVIRSDQAIACYSCGGRVGDPFDKITIKLGEFSIHHHAGGGAYRVHYSTTFKYNVTKNNWFLEKIHINTYKHTTSNKITLKTVKNFGVISFSQHDIGRDL